MCSCGTDCLRHTCNVVTRLTFVRLLLVNAAGGGSRLEGWHGLRGFSVVVQVCVLPRMQST